jgi:hypothetical protein
MDVVLNMDTQGEIAIGRRPNKQSIEDADYIRLPQDREKLDSVPM